MYLHAQDRHINTHMGKEEGKIKRGMWDSISEYRGSERGQGSWEFQTSDD